MVIPYGNDSSSGTRALSVSLVTSTIDIEPGIGISIGPPKVEPGEWAVQGTCVVVHPLLPASSGDLSLISISPVHAVENVPRIVPPTAHTRHRRLAVAQGLEMRLTVTRAEERTLERDHSGDGTGGS